MKHDPHAHTPHTRPTESGELAPSVRPPPPPHDFTWRAHARAEILRALAALAPSLSGDTRLLAEAVEEYLTTDSILDRAAEFFDLSALGAPVDDARPLRDSAPPPTPDGARTSLRLHLDVRVRLDVDHALTLERPLVLTERVARAIERALDDADRAPARSAIAPTAAEVRFGHGTIEWELARG
jgi:hypothetical protein